MPLPPSPASSESTSTSASCRPTSGSELTERLRDGRAARVMPFGPDSLTRVIAVTSGKGGVGKSTSRPTSPSPSPRAGLSVGLIDADVHGFSIPGLLGLVDAEGRTQRADPHRRAHRAAHRVRREGGLDRDVPARGRRGLGGGVARTDAAPHRPAVPHRRLLRRSRRPARSTCRRAPATSRSRWGSCSRMPRSRRHDAPARGIRRRRSAAASSPGRPDSASRASSRTWPA